MHFMPSNYKSYYSQILRCAFVQSQHIPLRMNPQGQSLLQIIIIMKL